MADKQNKVKKGLPKRASSQNPKHAKRMGHKARAAKRHEANRLKNYAQQVNNNSLRKKGLPTPWEIAKAKRYAKRH